jgi:hypothetical protein
VGQAAVADARKAAAAKNKTTKKLLTRGRLSVNVAPVSKEAAASQ